MHGLLSFDSDQYSVGVPISPRTTATTLTASYGWENYRLQQRSRSANNAADQADPPRLDHGLHR